MPLNLSIIGLPNVGKSTLFNALTQTQKAEVANYPFCTITPNRAIVPVHDNRVEEIAKLINVPDCKYATIEFVDVAGLVRGASKGEGLGNQFLSQIRVTDALVHTVRCYKDQNIVHVSGDISPIDDIETVNLELALADLEQLERKIDRLLSEVKGDRSLLPVLELAKDLSAHLTSGNPVSTYPHNENKFFPNFIKEMSFLTEKPVIYIANIAESALPDGNDYAKQVQSYAIEHKAEYIMLSAKLEAELAELNPEEAREYLEIAGISDLGLDIVIKKGFIALGLINFFTKNESEVRAWSIPTGTPAPKAAGVIHTDFERGFIRAEVVPAEVFIELGSEAAVRSAGQLRLEGKEYIVQDGDLIHFRFNI